MAGPNLRICYNPFFIAMGTTMRDFLFPEFVLFGVEDPEATALARQFYAPITDAPFFDTTVENAELIKVSYNTYIGMKIVFANTLMEICHKTPGTDVDQVVDCLELANRRLISPSYMRGGMGDGGGCHPRDNIALSWLARELDLSYDFFDSLMIARQEQTEWLADLMCSYALPKRIIGYAYKPGTEITTGSPALLLCELLKNRGIDVAMSDPVIDGQAADYSNEEPAVFLIGTAHKHFHKLKVPGGSVVIDPWRAFRPASPNVHYLPVGEGPAAQEPKAMAISA